MERSRTVTLALLMIGMVFGGWTTASARQDPPAPDPATTAGEVANPDEQGDAYERGYQGPPQLADSEKIAQLKRLIERDSAKLAELKAEQEDPDGEYAKAEAEYTRLNNERDALEQDLKELNEANNAEEVAKVQEQLAGGEKTYTLAKERFELAITERRTLQEQIATLESTLAEAKKVLGELSGNSPAASDAPTATDPAAIPTPPADSSTPAATIPPAAPQTSPAATQPAAPLMPIPGLPLPPTAVPGAAEPAANGSAADETQVSEELRQAREDADAKAEAVRLAQSEVEKLDQWLASVEHRLALEETQLETNRKRADNANDTRAALEEQFRERSVSGASEQELRGLMGQIEEAEDRFRQARLASRAQADRVVELQNERSQVVAEQLRARHDAALKQKEYEAAQGLLNELQNPLNPRNMLQWVMDRGPRVVALILAILGLKWFIRLSSRRVVPLIASRGARGSREEREDRARTLVGVFENFVSVVIVLGGTLMILETCGIPVMPLLGGAAVVGLAVAFGAQNLVRDFFYGFMILLENQYKINDVVRLGDVSGQVEQITLRMTVLRDLEGNVHFVPNGSIQRVTNMTHGWSRALFEITVPYKEDADQVMSVIMDLGRELRNDPAFRLLMLEEPTMLGVDAFGDTGLVIKFFIKTRTLKQWEVKREMLRRIKRRFDELGIEIPYPHRVVYHRSAEAEEESLRAIAEPYILSPNAHGGTRS